MSAPRKPDSTTRRGLLAVAGAAGAGVLLQGCGAGGTPEERSDDEIVSGLLALEEEAAAIYAVVVPGLPEQAREAIGRFEQHETDHAGALLEVAGRLGARPGEPPDVDVPGDLIGSLEAIADAERRQIEAQLDALAGLSDRGAREAVARILAVEAQHLSEVMLLLRRNPIPRGVVGEA